MCDEEHFVKSAYAFHALREPVLRSAIQTLRLPAGSRGLDAGCGIGLQTLLLAEAVGPAGHVTGLDLSSDLLAYAAEIAARAGVAESVAFRKGNVNQLPFANNTFDWVWSVDCVGYAPMEPLPLIEELARVVKPGGAVAILAWSSQTLLPGHPVLEARLDATVAGIAPFDQGMKPASHFLRALGWFREAGLVDSTARTFVGDAHAPLPDDLRSALLALFEMRWPGVETELSPAEWADYQRFCQPASPDFVVNHPDFYAFFTYSMFHGKVAG